jgi:hypothetical protein
MAATEVTTVVATRRRIARFLACQLCAVALLLCLGVSNAYAQEVPVGSTTVRIPIVLPADAAIAGGEIGFTQTEGLEYLCFYPAAGVQNPVKTTVGSTTYVGFFSSDNRYQPASGGLVMGDLEFSYTGNAAEQVVLEEIRLHTKTGSDVATQTLSPQTVYPVTRASSSSGGGTGGTGGTGSTGGSGGSDGGGTSGTGGSGGSGGGGGATSGTSGGGGTGGGGTSWGTIADNDGDGSVDEDSTVVAEASPGTTEIPGETGTVIDDGTTPLAAAPSADSNPQSALVWVLAGALLITLAALLFLLLKRRKPSDLED